MPVPLPHGPTITPWSAESIGSFMGAHNATLDGCGSSSVSRANFCPFVIWAPYRVTTLFWVNGATVAGNIEVAIYRHDGSTSRRVVTTGLVAQAGTSTMQTVTLGTPVTLLPGDYYLATAYDNGAATLYMINSAGNSQVISGVTSVGTTAPLAAFFVAGDFDSLYSQNRILLAGLANRSI